ncbi:unnamed protein product [Mycena citricolor]|uniref:NF-kappa-B-activating protein C-terminal domain-containing protein n=1 Tax=Mycena citricolor TaxID=2018698 RepID=A0AAD2K5A3_9AGAR|nr:unnamed protein product [Mycena citricolor]
MAFVHPSRAALVPAGPSSSDRRQRRSPSPRRRRRSISPPHERHESPGRDRIKSSRGSPEYQDYKRQLAPPPSQASYPQQPLVSHVRSSYQSGGGYSGDIMESRRAQRDAITVNVWPSSPKAPARDLSPSRQKSRKKSKRSRTSSIDSSEEEYRRRKERKEKKRARKERERERGHQHRTRHDSDPDDSHRYRSHSPRRTAPASRTASPRPAEPLEDEDEWVVKPATTAVSAPAPFSSNVPQGDDDSDEDNLGPQPLNKPIASKKMDERDYGGSLLRGEGSAMAAFLQDGTESRIPRRGEIGLTSDEIAKYEDVGYVMSGSRHRRMNAVRMRKENQVISAEEKRGILKLQKEERERREAILREEFSELVKDNLKEQKAPKRNADA